MLLAALLLPWAAGCEQPAPARERESAAPVAKPVAVEPPLVAATPADPLPAQIDPAPAEVASPEIVERDDISVDGEAACAFTVRYRGAVDQPVTWNGEPCAAVTARFMSLGDLRELGKADRLSAEALADIGRAPGQPVFYVEGAFTASVYPLNSAGRVYEVPVAD